MVVDLAEERILLAVPVRIDAREVVRAVVFGRGLKGHGGRGPALGAREGVGLHVRDGEHGADQIVDAVADVRAEAKFARVHGDIHHFIGIDGGSGRQIVAKAVRERDV